MRTSLAGAAAVLAILSPLTAFAADPAPAADSAPAAQPVATAQPADPVVCHYFYHEGMVINRPDCLTQHQWERRRLTEQRYISEFQLHSLDEHM